MAPSKTWFVIVNPISGNGSSRKKWPQIKTILKHSGFDFEYAFTEYEKHSILLTKQAIQNTYKNIICVGGDGTLHNIVNGIMSQNDVPSSSISVGMIPVGTGNDWVKTYQISKDFEKAIQIIKNGSIKQQDLGEITFLDQNKDKVYFNNLAGIGFDGYVVSKVHKYKHFGALAYLSGALIGLFGFKNFQSNINVNSKIISSKTLMVLVGLCQYSGGGMQLTKTPNPIDGMFNISVAKDIGKLDVIRNVRKLFNGEITNHKKVETFKSAALSIKIPDKNLPLIQADGELIGKGNVEFNIIPKAFSFYS